MAMARPDFLLSFDFYATHFSKLLVAAMVGGSCVLVASAFTGRGGDLIVGDAIGYFEYARSILIERRLPVPFVKYPCGVSMIGIIGYAPVVWVSSALIQAGVIANNEAWRTGRSLVEQIAFCVPLIVLAFIALRANVSMLIQLGFSERIVKPAVLFWLVGTNIGFFILKEPAMSESATYSTLSLYYWALLRWFYMPSQRRGDGGEPVSASEWIRRAVIVGLFLGFAGAIRQQNILHALAVPLLLMTQSRHLFGQSKRAAIAGGLRALSIIAASSAIIFAIPWVVWYATLGRFQLFMYYNEEHFNWLSPNPWAVLFVWGYHGLFLWHPIFLLASVGLIRFLRTHRDLLAAWLIPLLVQVYLICTWYWLSYGASFGHRGFFTCFPLLLPGFVAFLDYAVQRGKERPLIVGLWGLTAVNAVLALLFSLRIIELNGAGLPPT
jgi:hypothetical protein